MKNIKTFENYNYMFEDVELQSSDQMSSEEKKEIIEATAATTKVELANKSEFSQKLKSKVAQAQAQAQSEPEMPKNEDYIFENTGGEILSEENIQKYADSLVKKLPILMAGDKEVIFRGQKNKIPAGAAFEAYKSQVYPSSIAIYYKDKNGKYPEVLFEYRPSKDEIAHVAKIYNEFGKKLATQQKRDNLLTMGAKILIPLGVISVMAGMVITGSHHGSGLEAFREIPEIIFAGGGLLATGIASNTIANIIGNKANVAEEALSMFTSLIKAFCDSLDMNMMDIETVGDIETLLTMDKIEVEVENTTTSSLVERTRIKGFDKF